MKYFLISLFISLSAFAQSEVENNLNLLPENILEFEKINSENSLNFCQDLNSDVQKSNLICTQNSDSTPSSSQDQRLIYKVSSLDELPLKIKKNIPIENLKNISSKNPLYLSFWYDNDNILFDQIKGGNDYGYTTGLNVELSTTNDNGLTYGGKIYTGLYTKRVLKYTSIDQNKTMYKEFNGWDQDNSLEGHKLTEEKGIQNQLFIENSFLSSFIDNKKQGKWFYWSAELGVQRIEKNQKSKLLASGIQKGWHQMLGLVDYNYIPTKEDTKYGLFLETMVGAQKEIFSGSTCTLVVNSELGVSRSTNGGRDFFIASLGSNLGLFNNKVKLGTSTNLQLGKRTHLNQNTRLDIKFKRIILFNELKFSLNKNGYSESMELTPNFTDKDPIHRIGVIIPLR